MATTNAPKKGGKKKLGGKRPLKKQQSNPALRPKAASKGLTVDPLPSRTRPPSVSEDDSVEENEGKLPARSILDDMDLFSHTVGEKRRIGISYVHTYV